MPQDKKPKILCVDDEKMNLKVLWGILAPEGYEFKGAESGEAALAETAQHPPDLILLDIMMPKMNGFEVLKKLREDEKTRFVPVVMVTALRETEDRVKAIEAGCDDFISKPFDKIELLARVKSLVRIKTYHDQMQHYERDLEVEVARKTEKLRRALKENDRAHLEIIYRLSQAAEYRDEETGAHIIRMSYYARIIADKMGLRDRFRDVLFHAAPMHDVGKIGIPDSILLKPDKYTSDEWEIMKQHSMIGAKILKGSRAGVIRMAELIALTHHEKWNGSGYPQGLKGAKIPLAGRIAAIADVFDALISRRPYREPFPLEKAFGIIREGDGSHFDPKIVSIFFGCQDEVVAIVGQYKDQDESAYHYEKLK